MATSTPAKISWRRSIHRWVRRGFVLWTVVSLAWLANSVRTQGVPDGLLRSSDDIRVADGATVLAFLPTTPQAPGRRARGG